jgi:hypothetical protein
MKKPRAGNEKAQGRERKSCRQGMKKLQAGNEKARGRE